MMGDGMGGELLNGSRIWFPLSQTGTLAGSTRPSWSHVLYSDAASSTSPPCRGRRQISILICFLPSRLVATSTSLGCQQFQCHLLLHVSILIIYMLLVLIVRLALAGNWGLAFNTNACKFVSSLTMVEIMLCDQFFSMSSQSFGKSSRSPQWRGLAFNTIVWVQFARKIELSSLIYRRKMPASPFKDGWWEIILCDQFLSIPPNPSTNLLVRHDEEDWLLMQGYESNLQKNRVILAESKSEGIRHK